MNKKLLCAALLGGLSVAHVAGAQEFDDRWYLTGSVGQNFQDNDRNTEDAQFLTLGLGKMISPNWSLDAELNYQNPNPTRDENLNWSQYGISFDARRHFMLEGRDWHPYIVAGLGYQRSEEEFDAFPNVNSPAEREDGNMSAKLGVGAQTHGDRMKVRMELAYRYDADDSAVGSSYDGSIEDSDDFGDLLASIGVIIPLGAAAAAPAPAPAPAAPNCADLDDDGDGVNNCDDKCPGSQAGQTIGPDGCPVPVSIDLKGVNFDYDKSNLRPDAVSILSEATEILKRYPELKVEVAGHTDSKGTDAYNQGLSERRAKAVYDYLTSNGVDASRLAGPNGYGESRPIAPNTNEDGSDNPEGRAKNRRTELNVQN